MPTAFDIPSQPLPRALSAFSAATGIEVLVDARNAQARQSAQVKGIMPARRALQIILTRTRLIAEEFAPGTITLLLAPPERNAGLARPQLPYFAAIQRAVLIALCRRDVTMPGGYRLALRLEVHPDGSVCRSKLLSTTGSIARDEAVKLAMADLDIGAPPPRDLPQPIAVIVQPRASDSSATCLPAPPGARAP